MKTQTQIQTLLSTFQSSYNWKQIDLNQGSQDWLKLKLGVLSASNASKIVAKQGTQTREGYLFELVSQVATRAHAPISAAAVEWGKSFEEPARASFELTHGHSIEPAPFVFKDETFREGASPDGLIYDQGLGVEIKVPFNSTHHVASLVSDKIKPEYQWQCQFQMRALDCDEWLFCSYDPRFMRQPLKIIPVKRDQSMQSKLEDCVGEFISEMDAMLSELGLKFGEQWLD